MRKLCAAFCASGSGWEGLILRLGLAIVILPHGLQKVVGWFGGAGLAGTYDRFTEGMGIPAVLAVLVIAAESLGSVALILGFLTRLAAFGILCVMVGAIAMVHWQHGFFMNWTGQKAGEGFEFHLLAITLALGLLIGGAGRWSIDAAMAGSSRQKVSAKGAREASQSPVRL